MNAHTPGPWSVEGVVWIAHDGEHSELMDDCPETGADYCVNVGTPDEYVAICYGDDNAARIVACVNACEGIDDPADLRAQRDELLAACEALLQQCEYIASESPEAMAHPDLVAARAAIARAERGQ